MIPRYKPYFKIVDFLNFLRSPTVTMTQVEQIFAQKANCKYALVLPYGRSAYYFLLKACGYVGQEVILPAYTCNVLAGPILESGNTPVFVDSSDNGFNMDIGKIDQKINERTKMIVFTEIWGEPIPVKSFEPFKERGILLIGDYSLSLFRYLQNNGDVLGSLDAAFFSFALGKEISALGGGMIVTDNEELYNKIKKERDAACTYPGFFRGVKIFLKMLASIIVFSRLFYKYLVYLSEKTSLLNKLKGSYMDDANLPNDFFILPSKLQLYIIKNRLERIDEFTRERQHVLELYYNELSKAGILGFNPLPLASYIAYDCRHQPIKHLQGELFNNGVHTATVYKQSLPEILKQDNKPYPHAARLSKELTMLPLFYGITKAEIQYVVEVLKGRFKRIKSGNENHYPIK